MRRNGIKTMCGATFLLLFALGCNQESPATGDGDLPDWVWHCEGGASKIESAGMGNYPLPTSGTAKWSYYRHGGYELGKNDTLVADDDSFENLTMEAAEYEGNTAYMTEDTPTSKGKVTRNWHAVKGDRITRVHKKELYPAQSNDSAVEINYFKGTELSAVENVDKYVDGFVRFSNAWIVSPKMIETLAYNRLVTRDLIGNEGNLNKEKVRVHRFTVESIDETVSVPAGTFEGCAKIKRERMREPDDTSTINERRSDIKRYWFCPGVGKVKEQEVVDSPRIEELLYYCIPGSLCCE